MFFDRMFFDRIFLQGETVRLEPMEMQHVQGLISAAGNGELWNLSYTTCIPAPAMMESNIHQALELKTRGKEYPFVIVSQENGKIIGATRFKSISLRHKKLRIGDSWIAENWQRTSVNTECKYLMLKHTFEECSFSRVEFVVYTINHRSCKALNRIGATQEGVMRQAHITPDGQVMDVVLFSIIESEWPEIKDRMLARLSVEFKTYYA